MLTELRFATTELNTSPYAFLLPFFYLFNWIITLIFFFTAAYHWLFLLFYTLPFLKQTRDFPCLGRKQRRTNFGRLWSTIIENQTNEGWCMPIINRPFQNYLRSLFQSESRCSSFHIHTQMKIIFMWMIINLHMKWWAPRLALKKSLVLIFSYANQFLFTRKWNSFSCEWKLICIWNDDHLDKLWKRGLR